MPKMKTKKAIAKRFRKTGTGKIKHLGARRGHLLIVKSRKNKRFARGGRILPKCEEKRLIHLF